MARYLFFLAFASMMLSVAQQPEIPFDFRQHNLTKFNASLLDPTLSITQNQPRSLSLWSRWQWQGIDADPTSIFLNYTQMVNSRTAIGVGILQNNTGLFTNTGGNINTAFQTTINEDSQLYFGTNVFAFNQERNPGIVPDMMGEMVDANNFILQFSPALRLQLNGLSAGLVIQNALDFNLSDGEREAAPRIFTGILGYRFVVPFFSSEAKLAPQAYIRSIQGDEAQYGLNLLFDHSDFWVQGGYNSFYGISGGAGITLFDKLSLGALLEFGTTAPASQESSTMELVLSYHFGKQKFKDVIDKGEDKGKTLNEKKNSEAVTESKGKEEGERLEKMAEERRRLAEEERERQRLQREEQIAKARQQDSIKLAREAVMAAELEKARIDSIAKVERDKEVAVQPNEKYEEVVTSDGLEPGFYLIANVFGTERYFQSFMKTLQSRGLNPKSFKRSSNGYHYVYLGRYNSIGEARTARDSNLNGQYNDALWIFRVRGQ